MLSMFQRKINHPTRFDLYDEFSCISHSLDKLRKKNIDLKKENKGSNELICLKSNILDALVDRIESCIEKFNQAPEPKNKEEKTFLMIMLANALQKLLEITLSTYGKMLNKQRSELKWYLRNSVEAGTLAGAIGLGVVTGSILVGGGALIFGAKPAADVVSDATGLSENKTASYLVISDLLQNIKVLNESLHFIVNDLKITLDSPAISGLVLSCPITQMPIKEPVLCVLDGNMYEKKAIVQWLIEHKTSPTNRKKLQDDQTYEDVLIENFTLKQALDEFNQLILENKTNSEERAESENVRGC